MHINVFPCKWSIQYLLLAPSLVDLGLPDYPSTYLSKIYASACICFSEKSSCVFNGRCIAFAFGPTTQGKVVPWAAVTAGSCGSLSQRSPFKFPNHVRDLASAALGSKACSKIVAQESRTDLMVACCKTKSSLFDLLSDSLVTLIIMNPTC